MTGQDTGLCPACFVAAPLVDGVLVEHERTSTLIELDYVTGMHPVTSTGRCGGSGSPPHTVRVGLRATLAYIAGRYGRRPR